MEKFIRLFIVLILSGLCIEAKQTTLQRRDVGLLGAMQRMGCKSVWLSVVMRENGILEVELTRLPVGLRLEMPDSCGNESPSSEDVRITRAILEREEAVRKVGRLEQQVESMQRVERELTIAQVELSVAKSEITSSQQKLAAFSVELEKLKVTPLRVKMVYVGLGFVSCGAILAAWFFVFYTSRREVLKRRIVLIHTGTPVEFTLVSEPRHYKCSLCAVSDIEEKHLDRHLNRSHPKLRLETVA